MTEKHPMWSAIKRGMLIGGVIGLDLAFLFFLDWYNAVSLSHMFSNMLIGGGMGFLAGSGVGLIWYKLQAPFKRLEADLQSAAVLRAKELINEQDFQALKTRILAGYQPANSGVSAVLKVAAWAATIGATIGLGTISVNSASNLYGNDAITSLVVPLTFAGVGVGAAIAAIIQSALQGGKRNLIGGKVSQMLGAGQFDPLGQAHVNEADRIPAKR